MNSSALSYTSVEARRAMRPNHVAAAAAIHASTGAGRTRLWLLREITTRTATMKIALKKMSL